MELKKAAAVCFIALFAAALVVLIARALDMQAASKIQPELQKIAKELETIRRQVSGGAGMATGADNQADLSDGVIVYYAHSNTRCPTCRSIESQAHEAVESGFAAALKAGAVRWELVNYEEAAGKRFVDDYGVQMPTVVLIRMKDGKAADWRRLDKVWGLVGDKGAFIDYVQAEIRAMQEPPASFALPADIPIPDAVPLEDGSPPADIPIPDAVPSENDLPAPLPAPILPSPQN